MFVGYTVIRHHTSPPLQSDSVSVPPVEKDTRPTRRIETSGRIHLPKLDEKQYLSYLPHGGFHTQRIALENALTLCRLLDRTLLLPPLWIGRQAPWRPHPELQYGLGNTTKSSLSHCQNGGTEAPECEGYDTWSQVSWEWLIDVGMADVDWVDRWNFTDAWMFGEVGSGGLGLQEADVHRLQQTMELGTQIVEDVGSETDTQEETASSSGISPGRPYTDTLKLSKLRYLPNRLIQFDSLAGSNRLRLYSQRSRWIRNEIRSTTVIANDLILEPAKEIASLLSASGGYISLDARISGHLASSAGANMRAAWWELGRRMGVKDEVLEEAEKEVWTRSPGWREAVTANKEVLGSPYPPPPIRLLDPALADARALRQIKRGAYSPSKIPCPRLLHSKTSLLPLNTPLFISSSSANLHSHPALRLFYSTFPCIFTLDTPEINAVLEARLGAEGEVVNDPDGYEMGPWMREWVGAEVAARAAEVVGTHGTAWGKWAEEMVQPVAKG
jgi:hypothetical protein